MIASAFDLNGLVIRTPGPLALRGTDPPEWRSSNEPGGGNANAQDVSRFRQKVRGLRAGACCPAGIRQPDGR